MSRALLGCIWIGVLAAAGHPADDRAQSGTIVGTVVDDHGTPVSGAKVHAEALDSAVKLTFVRFVETDEHGAFSIDPLDFGAYRVDAMKPSDGYANTAFEFHSNGRQPRPVLSPSVPKVAVLVVVGPRAGTITGPVSDAVTGKPVNATFHMWRASRPEAFLDEGAASPCRILVPPDVEVGVEVHASGYEVWYYPGDGVFGRSMPLRLKPGEELRVDIRLQPLGH